MMARNLRGKNSYYAESEKPKQTNHVIFLSAQEYYDLFERSHFWQYVHGALLLLLALLLLVIASSRDISPRTLTIPLELLPVQTFSATTTIVPTGTSVVPATNARGVLTLYNGLIVARTEPKGSIVISSGGVEFATDEVVVVPTASPPMLGQAHVAAHAVVAGGTGNIAALAINAVSDMSLYLKNTTAFSGGADSYTVPAATDKDRQRALSSARAQLHAQIHGMLDRPCDKKQETHGLTAIATWSCQFVQYHVPDGMSVVSWQRDGDRVVLWVRR